ncbi:MULTISPECIES: LytR/AlgR family response regulator transcription factor [Silvimonas]|uniref:Two-component system response regulator AlgR n=4 Tax=Silvimonas TaxID=300264 RepID=A0A840RI76_9NEIS|nr:MULTISPECIES: LytTR family DNA-binding domain-containing protein [Silvimonas]MBB5191953.1 two-component system response regulator AlgR [Silvimonas terrae]GGP23962.1 DNA-binding response regulator [Silvimonas iriomotensis]GGP25752.1 DNA-binding response regulator [Silvimonas amylolytica]
MPALRRLEDVLNDVSTECPVEIVGSATNGVSALTQLAEADADAAIIDIQMPQMSGIELARELQGLSQPPAIIFATAFEEYGVAAFEVRAIDYLLKPIRRERLLDALNRVLELRQARSQAEPASHARSHFSVTERGRLHLIPVAEARYLKAEQKYITLRTREREYLLEDSLTRLEEEFGSRFVRIHRNCLVARDSLVGFEKMPSNGGETHWVAVLKDVPERLAVSRRQQHVIKEFKRNG